MGKTILLAAGGTGGHLFPAEALAQELTNRGCEVHLATDERARTYGREFPAKEVHIVASATFGSRHPVALAKSGLKLALGQMQSLSLVGRVKPDVAVGFGGYPTVPPLLAATLRRVPIVVHEANAVMGRANRFLADRAKAVATSFPTTALLGKNAGKAYYCGNPVRQRVIAQAGPYIRPALGGPFRLVVFGGSQGARVFSEIMPAALGLLTDAHRRRLQVIQQARPEDVDAVRQRYAELGILSQVAPFFAELPALVAEAHLVICRSGASSVTELAVIGRPSILVPLPHSLDADQRRNAMELERAGGAIMAEQNFLTPGGLSAMLMDLMDHPGRLADMAAAAASQGRPDAVYRLADLVQEIAEGRTPVASGTRHGDDL